MSRLDSLPPDLHATLSLLLRQRKRPGEVATLLGVAERAVHDRAQAALVLLAPREARALSPSERELLGEHLLGEPPAERAHTARALLAESAAARVWARALVGELTPLAAQPLPAIPPDAPIAAPIPAAPAEPVPTAPAGLAAPAPTAARGSRTGGAVILGALAVAVLVAVLLIVGVGGGSGGGHARGGARGHQRSSASAGGGNGGGGEGATGTTSGGSASHGKALALTPPNPATSKAVGAAYVLTQNGKRAFYVFTKGLPAPTGGAFYAVWLEGSSGTSASPLGSLPPQSATGLIEGGGPLPGNASAYHRIVITRETDRRPTHPGTVVLGGAFSLG